MWTWIVQIEHFSVITLQIMIMSLYHRFELVFVIILMHLCTTIKHLRFSANTNNCMFLFNIKCKSPQYSVKMIYYGSIYNFWVNYSLLCETGVARHVFQR